MLEKLAKKHFLRFKYIVVMEMYPRMLVFALINNEQHFSTLYSFQPFKKFNYGQNLDKF